MARFFGEVAVAVCTIATLNAPAVLAQTAAVPQDAAPAATPTVTALADDTDAGDIIVTAQRRSQTLERTPVSVAVIGTEALATQVIVSEADLQFATPGLTVKAGQGSNQLNYSIRGQTVDAFTSSRPSVLPYFNEVQVGGVGASSFYDLDSVQVLKGPQGTLFGRNSTGGAVLFTSVKPSNDFGGYVTLRGGNYAQFMAEGAINVPIVDDKVLLRVAGYFQRRNGFQFNLFDNKRVGDVKRENVRVSLTLKPNDTIENNLVVSYSNTGGGSTTGVLRDAQPIAGNLAGEAFVPSSLFFGPSLDGAIGFPGAWNLYLAAHPGVNPLGLIAEAAAQNARGPFVVSQDGSNFIKAHSWTMSNITTIDVGEDTQIKNVIGYLYQDSNEGGEFDGSHYGIDSNGIFGQNNNDIGRGGIIKQFSEELQLGGKIFDQKLTYVAGIFFSNESDHGRSLSKIFCVEPIIPCTDQYNSGLRKNKTYAAYGQGTFDLGNLVPGLSVTAGARYSSEKVSFEHTRDDFFLTNPRPEYVLGEQSRTFKNFSWQLGVEEQLTDNLLLYVKSRRGFRTGGFNFYAPPLRGFGNDAGAEYKSEVATDIELGAKFRGDVGGAPVRLNLAVYTMTIDDIQRANYVAINGSLAGLTVNVPQAKVKGFELDGTINPAPWLSMGGSVNYTDAKFTKPNVTVLGNTVRFGPYADTPEWSGSMFAEVKVPVNDRIDASLRGDVYAQSMSFIGSTNDTINPNSDIAGYAIANFRLGIEDTQTGWSVAGIVKNAFNRTYYVGGIAFWQLLSLNTVVPGEPRTFLVEAKLKF